MNVSRDISESSWSPFFVLLAWLVLGLPSAAQVTSGTIEGTVTDSSRAPVPGVKITITDIQKNSVREYTTDETGGYNAPFLPPGTYRVAAEKAGFKRVTSASVVLNVDDKARVDITLGIGDVKEVVEVGVSAPLVREDSSELGEVIGERSVRELPLNGRNFAQLVYLVPGVTPGQAGENLSGASTFNPRGASNFNALGSQANTNAWLVDGVDDNEYTFNTVMVQPSVESIGDFSGLTNLKGTPIQISNPFSTRMVGTPPQLMFMRDPSQMAGITTLSTGRPYSVTLNQGVNNGAPSWPNRICDGNLSNPDPALWFNTQCFVAPPPPGNTYGNVARGVLYGPSTVDWDLSLVKNTVIRERLRAQIRLDAFNAFNTPNFGFPNAAIGSPLAGRITSTINDNRDLQLALRLEF